MAAKLGESFDSLACAATIKADTMDSHARIISTLSTTNAKLVATNKTLVSQLAALTQKGRNASTPPGFTPSASTTPASTSHAMTTAGTAAPTTYNAETQKYYFVEKQACSHCARTAITHVPTNCIHNPANKAQLDARNALQAARRAGKPV